MHTCGRDAHTPLLAILLGLLFAAAPAWAQYIPAEEELLLPERISREDVLMRGRYARQWKSGSELVVLFNGGFRLDLGKRQLKSDDAVVWILPGTDPETGVKYYEFSIYLSGRAEVREPAGTVTEDSILMVTNLRSSGRIVKEHDAHSPESLEDSPLYQEGLAARGLVAERTDRNVVTPTEAGVVVARPEQLAEEKSRPPREIRFQFGTVEPARTPSGEQVQVATNGVYFSQTGSADSNVLEIRADNAVVFTAEGGLGALVQDAAGEPAAEPAADAEDEAGAAAPPRESPIADRGESGSRERRLTPESEQLAQRVKAVYLEGDVVLTLGDRFIRASRLFYDFEQDRALILDGVLRVDLPERGVPLYVRADEIRQLSTREFSAENARVTTSEFYTPHYHVGVGKIIVRDRTSLDRGGRPVGEIVGSYEMRDATFNILNKPLLYWPYTQGDYASSETLIRSARFGYSDDRGAIVSTRWSLFNLLGLVPPQGYDADLELDYFSERGPAIGVNSDYETADRFGLFRSYYINDKGEDDFGPLRGGEPESDNRGRILWRHRHYLPNDWEATLEFAYVSDPGFLEEYEKSEWFEGKQQETVLYLKKAREVDALTLLANWRMLDFVTQTEHLPELAYRRIGDTFGPFVNYAEGRIGMVRYRPDDRRFLDERRFTNNGLTDSTVRADGRNEIELPIKLPGWNLVGFSTFRGSYWDGQPLDEGGLWRGLGLYGLRGGGFYSKVYDNFRSELFDINRIRHVVQPQFIGWWAHSNARSDLITPFDEGIETIDDFHGGQLALRQAWQTKRGGPGRERTVDLLTFDLEAGFFGDRQSDENSNGYVDFIRPEDSRTRNYIAGEAIWRTSDTTSLLYDFNVDLDNWGYDRHNIALAVERLPRLAYIIGYRRAGDIDLELIGGGWNYRLNEKHLTAFRIWYDVDRSQLGEMSISYIRRLPRWYVAFTIDTDEVFDDLSFSLSVWPEGVPEWTIGSRRFTGLSTTTGIRP